MYVCMYVCMLLVVAAYKSNCYLNILCFNCASLHSCLTTDLKMKFLALSVLVVALSAVNTSAQAGGKKRAPAPSTAPPGVNVIKLFCP